MTMENPVKIREAFTRDLKAAKKKYGHGFNTYLNACTGVSTGYITGLLDPEESGKKASLKMIKKLRPTIDQINYGDNLNVETEDDDEMKNKYIASIEMLLEARDREIAELKQQLKEQQRVQDIPGQPTGTHK